MFSRNLSALPQTKRGLERQALGEEMSLMMTMSYLDLIEVVLH